ncbi:MAG: phage tail domain-containing protein [Paraclostridium sp.]
MQFLSEKFIFDGITSDDMSVELITFDDDIIKDFGNIYKQDMNSEGNLNNNPFYSETFSELDDTVLNVVLVDVKSGVQKKWTPLDMQRVVNWLTTKSFKPFVSYDNDTLVYYFKCINIDKKLTVDGSGYLECTFKMFGNYAYELLEATSTVNGNGAMNIINTSNLDSPYKPVLRVSNLGNDATINTISVNGSTLEIKGLSANDIITIDNKMCSVTDSLNNNRISNVNRRWISLLPGNNSINIRGNCKVELFAEFPIIM